MGVVVSLTLIQRPRPYFLCSEHKKLPKIRDLSDGLLKWTQNMNKMGYENDGKKMQ